MAIIFQQTIDKINEATQIDDVIGEFVSLKRKGSSLWGLCPFHDDHSPSLSVSQALSIFTCFGCNESGDAIEFLRKHEGFSFPEALIYLANKYNIFIEESEIDINKDLKDSLFIANSFAQNYFVEALWNSEQGKTIGLSYLRERDYKPETIKKFHLGYALDEWDGFSQTAIQKGYKTDLLIDAGLSSKRNNGLADVFRGRVLFPIHNLYGKIVGFGGRTLRSGKNIPKYINTRETEIYHKSKILYGLYFAKNAIIKEDKCLLVEGYTDVITLSQWGIENVVGSSGTAFTTDQINSIKRFTDNITLLYDADEAGKKAALRAVNLILQEDMNVNVVLLPQGKDPDSLLKDIGAWDFIKYIESNEKNFIQFKADYLLLSGENDPIKKAKVIKEIVHSVALIPDSIRREQFIKYSSKLLDASEETLVSEITKLRKEWGKEVKTATRRLKERPRLHEKYVFDSGRSMLFQEKDLIRILLEYGALEVAEGVSVAQVIINELQDVEFEQKSFNKVLSEFRAGIKSNSLPDQQYFLGHSDKDISSEAINILHTPYHVSENWQIMHDINVTDKKFIYKKEIKSSICRYKLTKLMELIKVNQQKLKESNNPDEIKRYQTKLLHYLKLKKELANDIGVVVP